MSTVVSFKAAKNIKFPVYKLPSDNWWLQDGLLFLDGMLLDDRNMTGERLGIRRIQTPFFSKLLPLKNQIDTLAGIVKQSSSSYIDSLGRTFIYEKTLMCKLSYYKIKKIERKDVASLLWVSGVNFPFTIPRPPESGMIWAGILHFHGLPWILYEYSETKLKDTHRKV
jgi:hypothetical protein